MTKKILVLSGFLLSLAMLIMVGPSLIAKADTALTASITAPATAQLNQSVEFSVQVSGGSGFYSYIWNFGDGSQAAGQVVSHTYGSTGAKTVTVTVTDTQSNQVSASHTITINAPDPALSVAINAPANGSSHQVNQSVEFSVQVSGGSGFYSYIWNFGDGSQAAGQVVSHTYGSTGAKTVTVTVTDTGSQQATDSIVINVVEAAAQPSVDLKVNNSDGPITVSDGTAVTLHWSTQNVTECTASGAWSGSRAIGDSETTVPLSAGTYTYTLTCTGPGGSASDSVTVQVEEGTIQTPVVDLKANGQNGPITIATSTAFTLSWTSANITSCTASGAWAGSRSVSGSETVVSPSAPGTSQVFTLTCTGPGGSASDSVTVSTATEEVPPGPLTITNVRVTDVTANSAVVRWTTNRPATSRVIYDTVSRSIAGQSAPNFGYAFSTGTDSAKVVEHAMTITGLSPSTTYFFRAISQE